MAKEVKIVEEKNEEIRAPKSRTPSPLNCSTPSSKENQNEAPPARKKYALLKNPTIKFWEIAEAKDEASRAVPVTAPVSNSLQGRISGLAHKINWNSLKKLCKEWFKNPMNIALFIWIICVVVSGGILFLVMTGVLNSVLPKESQRITWFEVNNQIINALFTLLCLYEHPRIVYHSALLLRWNPNDILKLRKIYCKNGTYKPHEWAHMLVVILLLHLTFFSQYALCCLNLGYSRSERAVLGVTICISVTIVAPAIAGIYVILSPLGKEYAYNIPIDEEAQPPMIAASASIRANTIEKRLSFMVIDDGEIVDDGPEWKGGILDLWDDISISYLSLFCTFCVFGRNMERLGFGNMYVHIGTFILFCSAPFFIFNLSALNIDDERVRQTLGITGFVLCAFGFLYGGYWRMRMRKRFDLPGYTYTSCCGNSTVSDCAFWLFCCWCSLAQEVRTANFYDIVENKFCKKRNRYVEQWSSDSPYEDGSTDNSSNLDPSSQVNSSDVSMISTGDPSLTEEDSVREGMSEPMTPPHPLTIEK